jgi:hypothetical protein
MMDLAEFANQASEILYGCREHSEEDMLFRMRELVDLERTVQHQKNLPKIKKALSRCLERLDELGVT